MLKFISIVLIMASFGNSNDAPLKFLNGQECSCDSIKTVLYDTKEIHIQYPYINSKINGIAHFYLKNGKLWSEYEYRDGFTNGRFIEYFENGSIKTRGIIIKEKVLHLQGFYPSGQIKWENQYVDTTNVYEKKYYESGKLMSISINDSLGRFLKHESYYENGYLQVKEEDNSYIQYYDSGSIKFKFNYLINEKGFSEIEGDYVWYFKNGSIAGVSHYRKGYMIGLKECSDGRKGNEQLDCLKNR